MAYTPTVWKNGEFPPIDAEHLNKIEQGIANSAPGGFGLGELSGRTVNSFSDITGYGFYRIPTESGFAPDTSTNWGGVYIGASLSYGTLLYARNSALMAVREVSGGEVGPIEWINPPMQLGVEYRTTERYLGKPVYCKVIDCGAVPDANTNKTVDFADLGISRIISWTGNVDVGGNTFALPYQEIGREADNATIYVFVNYAGITLRTDSRWFAENGGTAQCTIWYTKTPD